MSTRTTTSRSRQRCLTCDRAPTQGATRVRDNGELIVVCADCMADLKDGHPIGTTHRTMREEAHTKGERRREARRNLKMDITVTTPHAKTTYTGRMTSSRRGPALQNIPIRSGGDNSRGLSSDAKETMRGRQSSGKGRSATASGWRSTRPARRAHEAANVNREHVQTAVDIDLLDFPEFPRNSVGLAVGVRVAPTRPVWDLLVASHLPLNVGAGTLPTSVMQDGRVRGVWTTAQATIRRLRTRLRDGLPNIEVQPRWRYGRIQGVNHLTGHAVVHHGDGVIIHWPTHVLMPIPEDEPLPADLIVVNEDDNAPTFDPDDFRARRKGKR